MKIEMSGLVRVGASGFVDGWIVVEEGGDVLRMRREG
jgi:hypothetical protein